MLNYGTETGSLVNGFYSRAKNPEPEVGMGATILNWTDRKAGTVINCDSKTGVITVQLDTATRTDKNGMSEDQVYEYVKNENGPKYHFRKNKTGTYNEVVFNANTGRWKKSNSNGVIFGFRRQYHDYSF